jgi:hypothetical protein
MSRTCGTCIGAGLLLFAVGCGGGGATPEAAFKEFQAAIKAKDADKAWNLMSKSAQDQMDEMSKPVKESLKILDKLPPEARKPAEDMMAQKLGMTVDDLKAIDGKKMFSLALKNPDKLGAGAAESFNEMSSATLESVKVEGDKATGTVKTSKKSDTIHFVKEGGSWKITPPK